MDRRLMMIGGAVAACWFAAAAPVSAQTVNGPSYRYRPPPGYVDVAVHMHSRKAHSRRRGSGGAYHANVPGSCAVDLGYGRWQSCDSLGPR